MSQLEWHNGKEKKRKEQRMYINTGVNTSPLTMHWSRYSVMQCVVLCLLWEVGSNGALISLNLLRQGDRCLLSSFYLVDTKYVRYLMAFWCMSFMKLLMLDFGNFNFVSLSMECSWVSCYFVLCYFLHGGRAFGGLHLPLKWKCLPWFLVHLAMAIWPPVSKKNKKKIIKNHQIQCTYKMCLKMEEYSWCMVVLVLAPNFIHWHYIEYCIKCHQFYFSCSV